MTTKRIIDIRMSTVNGKMLKTTFYSDGSKMTAIVPEKATERLIKSLEGLPDLKVISRVTGKQSGSIGYALMVALVVLGALLTGCVEEDDRCVRPGWHEYDDCWGEP